MKMNLASRSLFLFGVSVILWVMLTLFESMLVGMSLRVERVVTILSLVLPAALGVMLGVMGWARKDGHTWLAIAGVILNALFAIFHLMVILFAG